MSKIKARKSVGLIQDTPRLEGSAGHGSIDFLRNWFDFLDPIDLPSLEDIQNYPKYSGGAMTEDWDTCYRNWRDAKAQHGYETISVANTEIYRHNYRPMSWKLSSGKHEFYHIAGMRETTYYKGSSDLILPKFLEDNLGPFFKGDLKKHTVRIEWSNIEDAARNISALEFGSPYTQISVPEFVTATVSVAKETNKFKQMELSNSVGLDIINSVKYTENTIIIVSNSGSVLKNGEEVISNGANFFKLDLETGNFDTTFALKRIDGTSVSFSSGEKGKLFVANGNIFYYSESMQIIFEDSSQYSGKLIKINSNGVIDETFFPELFSFDELVNVFFHNGQYYFAFYNLYEYSNLNGDLGIIKVGTDGLNPILVYQNQVMFDSFGEITTGVVCMADQLSNGDIVFIARDNNSNTQSLYKISVATDSLDLSFTFEDISEAGDYTLVKRKYEILQSPSNVYGIKVISTGDVIVHGQFNEIVYHRNAPDSITYNVGCIAKFDSLGDLDLSFNHIGDKQKMFKSNNTEYITTSGLHINNLFAIRRVYEIDSMLYVIGDGFSSYNSTLFSMDGDSGTNLIRIGLDGSYDKSFKHSFNFSTYGFAGFYKFNNKYLFLNNQSSISVTCIDEVYSEYIGYTRMNTLNGSNFLNGNGIDGDFIGYNPYSDICLVQHKPYDYQYNRWIMVEGSSKNTKLSAWGTSIFEIDLNADLVDYSKRNPLFFEYDMDCRGNDFTRILYPWEEATSNHSEIFTKYLNGEELLAYELQIFNQTKSAHERRRARPEYFPNISSDSAMPSGNFKGFAPFGWSQGDHHDFKYTSIRRGTPMSQLFPSGVFNLRQEPHYMDSYWSFGKKMQGQVGDIAMIEGDWCLWSPNAITNDYEIKGRWIYFAAFEDMISYQKSQVDAKLRDLYNVVLSQRPFTWANYHIIKANLDEYIATL